MAFAISMPMMMAIMMALTGLRSNPSSDSPIQVAANVADMDTKTASAMPAHQPGDLKSVKASRARGRPPEAMA